MFWFQQYNQSINKVIFHLLIKHFFITLANGTGGSIFDKVVAAFSYSGASRLPLK
jgi:hypothetical protein